MMAVRSVMQNIFIVDAAAMMLRHYARKTQTINDADAVIFDAIFHDIFIHLMRPLSRHVHIADARVLLLPLRCRRRLPASVTIPQRAHASEFAQRCQENIARDPMLPPIVALFIISEKRYTADAAILLPADRFARC